MQGREMGVIGLGVMGANLALNLMDKGVRVVVYDQEPERTVAAFLNDPGRKGDARGAYSLPQMVRELSRPRALWLMIRAGKPVDEVLQSLLPLLDRGDVVIDGGNTHFSDTVRRQEWAARFGVYLLGMGVSGGKEGARHGPSLMVGGDKRGWEIVRPYLEAIAARAGGETCVGYLGEGGAGHFVKMVHNGIEYADMEILAEAWQMMREGLGLSPFAAGEIFSEWNEGILKSYLVEITAQALRKIEPDGTPLVERIRDAAGQKGTGSWAAQEAMEAGVPLSLIAEAVFQRSLSARRAEREGLRQTIGPGETGEKFQREEFLEDLREAIYLARVLAYAQGFALLASAGENHAWHIDLACAARLWRGGCILRGTLLEKIADVFSRTPELSNLLLDEEFAREAAKRQAALRKTLGRALRIGTAAPVLCAALSYFDSLRAGRLPADLIQAQRDCFGAHGFERVDAPPGRLFHANWSE